MTIKYPEDFDLVDKYLSGNKEAGNRLYSDVYSILRYYIYNKVNGSILSVDDKEDLILDVLKTSIEKLNTYDGTCKFSTFVISIAKLKIKEAYREKSKLLNKEELVDNIEEYFIGTEDYYNKNPLEVILDNEKAEALKNSLQSLGKEYQVIIKLKMSRKKTKEIAEMFEKSEDAIDSMYRRAIQSWKNIFNKIYNNSDGK